MGDWGGLSSKLVDRGVAFFGSYDAEVWGNTKGGLESGTVYTGLLDFGLKLDLEKAEGWPGASLSTTWLLLSGKNASNDLVGNFRHEYAPQNRPGEVPAKEYLIVAGGTKLEMATGKGYVPGGLSSHPAHLRPC